MNETAGSVAVCTGSALFTDLVGFTEYNDIVGDVAALAVLERQTALARMALDGRTDARIVKELGDGLMMWFGSAIDAVGTATTLLEAVLHARAVGEFPLSIRMGIHHGEAIARGDDVIGQTINIAARVSGLAGPGELLVSDRVVAACAPTIASVDVQPVGPVMVRGVREAVWIQRVLVPFSV